MNVFKFGGASVKDASAVRNVSHILSLFPNEQLIVVISAMGKTTNNLLSAGEFALGESLKWLRGARRPRCSK